MSTEEIGGPPDYEEYLKAIKDPSHERYPEFTECYDANFNPAAIDTDVIRRELATLAKRWSRPSRKRNAG